MPRWVIFAAVLLSTGLGTSVSADRQGVTINPIENSPPRQLRPAGSLAAADTCMPIAVDSLVWIVDGWLVGNELYKVLLDPEAACPNPYPFTVTEVHMILGFGGPTSITYSGDVEEVDWTDPSCPYPDTILGLSPTYQDYVPEGDIYDFWVEFDPPVVVNGPFFAGFYLGSDIDPNSYPAVVTDDNPVLCNSYNIWDESIGWVDLANNEFYVFPGRVAMFAVGYTGGTSAVPVADFSATPTATCPGSTVSFTNLSSGQVTSYLWDFGDGATSTEENPTHTYESSGSYPVSLTAVGTGGTDVETKAAFIDVWSPPVANFTAAPLSGSAPLTVAFSNHSSNATSYLWQFGDGTFSDETAPSHTYAVDGNYTVTMTATGQCGSDQATEVSHISVSSTTLPPEPELRWLWPPAGEQLMGETELWVSEMSQSDAIDYVRFDYIKDGGSTIIGSDFDGAVTLRDGGPASAGRGFSMPWDFSSLAEGSYWLKATVRDTLGRSDAESVFVYLEPTPPLPAITSPDDGADFCEELLILMNIPDEDMTHVEIHRSPARLNYSCGLGTISATDAESGPAAAALLAELWSGRGYDLMSVGATTLSTAQLTDSLAARAGVAEFGGAADDRLLGATVDYFTDHGHNVAWHYRRNPSYHQLRQGTEEQQDAVMIGLTGASSVWLAVDGFNGWPAEGDYHTVVVSDPTTGSHRQLDWRPAGEGGQLLYGGSWHDVDLMLALHPDDWSVSRSLMGADFDASDGWSYQWAPNGSVEPDSLYFFRATGYDAGAMSAGDVIMLRYSCASSFLPGDYNDDGFTNILDLVYIVEYVTAKGEAPIGGAERADANGDGYVNIADVIYYMNFLFGEASPPSY